MIIATAWQHQDILHLSKGQWLELLLQKDVFDHNDLKFIEFVYQSPNCTATASEIADHFGVHYNKVTARNRRIAKRWYCKFGKEPSGNAEGTGYRYWNIIFDGIPENPQDKCNHFFWRLRPNLIQAWEEFRNEKQPLF